MTIAADGDGNLITAGPDGVWRPAQTSINSQTGTKLMQDAADGTWHPLPGQGPSAVGAGLRGVVQGATFGFGDEVRAGTDALVQGVGNLFRGSEGRPTMGEAYDKSLAASREQQQLDQSEHPYASTAGQIVGGVGSTVAGGAALGAGRAALGVGRLITNPVGRAAITGATTGGVTGFGEGEGGLANRATGAAEGAALGGVAGAGIGAAEQGITRAITPIRPTVTPEYGRLVGVADTEGIPLTAGEKTGSKPLKAAETNLAQMPFAAGPAADAADQQAVALNKSVLSRAGVTGEDRVTSDVLKKQTANLGGQIGQLAENNNLQVTPDFVLKVGAIRQGLRYLGTDAPKVEAQLDSLQKMFTTVPGSPDAIVPGPAYKNLLSDVTRSYSNATGDVRHELGQFRNLLRTQMESSMAPDDAAKWRELNRQYANLALIKDAMGGAGAGVAEGNISPLTLRGALDRSMGGDAYAMGYGDLNDIARMGQSVLRKPPDSGTGIRTYLNQLMTGAMTHGGGGGIGGTIGTLVGGPVGGMIGGTAGALLGPRMVQGAMTSRLGQAYLTNQLAPDWQTIARALAGGVGTAVAPRNRVMND